MVEVYINSRRNTNSRCPTNSSYQNASENTRASGTKRICEPDKKSGLWNQTRDQTWSSTYASQEVTLATQTACSTTSQNPVLRRSNAEKSLQNKKRVIKMLLLVVLEFFICWTPLYIINTIALFDPILIYQDLGYHAVSVFQLLAYSSSCCNPITYCFMNSGFRKAFLNLFNCFKRVQSSGARRQRCNSNMIQNSANSNTVQTVLRTIGNKVS